MRTSRRAAVVAATLGLALAAAAGCGGEPDEPAGDGGQDATTGGEITVTSTAFEADGKIPTRYSCRGEGVTPPLAWTGVPSGTAALALVVDDPDAVNGLFVHWVVTDIPPTASGSAEGGAPTGGSVSENSGGDRSYLGPCPPKGSGTHHYRFTVYALDKRLDLPESTSAKQAVDAVDDAAVAKGRLVGTFSP
jgi:Raf kinase inhibitor-like YbhB/YbcL family protein